MKPSRSYRVSAVLRDTFERGIHMRKLALAAALATSALATPALARDNSWYVGVDAGVLLVEDQDLTFDAVPPGGAAVPSIDYHKGYDFDANIGYDFGGFRLEAEAAYKRAKIDFDKTGGGFGGAASALSFMLNGLLDFGPDDGLQGFVGGGVGVSRGKLASDIVNDSDTGFAWQAIAGVRYPVTNNVDVSLKYRFFNQDDIKLIPAYQSIYGQAGSNAETKLRTHSLLLGLTYNFGAPEEARRPRRRLRRPRRLQSASRDRTSCSSNGTSRTSRLMPPPFWTTRFRPTAAVAAPRSCLPVTRISRVRRRTTSVCRSVALTRSRPTSRRRVSLTA